MLAKELAETLLQVPDKEVRFAMGDGGCSSSAPVEIVEEYEHDVLLNCK